MSPQINPLYHAVGMAAVVIDVGSGDILALVSLPTYDLNSARYKYGDILQDPNKPAINRAINKQYLPGSSVKPIILIAAMETGLSRKKSSPSTRPAPPLAGCPIFRGSGVGHSDLWTTTAVTPQREPTSLRRGSVRPLVLQRWSPAGRPRHYAGPAAADGR
jgi:penicillin-binding protein 2